MRRIFWPMIGLMALLLPVTIAGAAQAGTVHSGTVTPRVACTGSPQRCDDLLQNQAETFLYLGNANGTAILNVADGAQTQRWDIYELADGNYVIYNNGTNNVLTRGGSCGVNGSTYLYCAVVEPQGSPTPADQQWNEVQVDPFIFQSDGSGNRCLDDPDGAAFSGQQAVLYTCPNLNQNTSEQWLAKSSS